MRGSLSVARHPRESHARPPFGPSSRRITGSSSGSYDRSGSEARPFGLTTARLGRVIAFFEWLALACLVGAAARLDF